MERKYPGLPRAAHASGVRMDAEYEEYVPREFLEAELLKASSHEKGVPKDALSKIDHPAARKDSQAAA
jgi:hypothetical protein